MEIGKVSQRRYIVINVAILAITLIIFFVVKENYKKWLSEYTLSLESDNSNDNTEIGEGLQDVVDQAVNERILSGRNMNNPLSLHRFSSQTR